uniref:Uncharacterized protein n=1 Tax=Anguilla anguilla TaxID=7936 RepID=A0A0E9W809_ANGAN
MSYSSMWRVSEHHLFYSAPSLLITAYSTTHNSCGKVSPFITMCTLAFCGTFCTLFCANMIQAQQQL